MNLSDLFEETMTDAPPPSRWTAADAYRIGRRRRRVALATRTGLALLPALALVVALVMVVVPSSGNVAAPPASSWFVYDVGGFDRQHLYAYFRPCETCAAELRTTEDGGRTWTTPVDEPPPGSQGVLTSASGGVAMLGGPSSAALVSTDGWGSFRPVEYSDVPVTAPPTDSPVLCDGGEIQGEDNVVTHTGTVQVIDIPGGRFGPTATQPPFICQTALRAPNGTILAAGSDGVGYSPAVAQSFDNGNTWVAPTLPTDLPADDDPDGLRPRPPAVAAVLASPKDAAVVAFGHGSQAEVYRYESGAWRRLVLTGPLPDNLILAGDNTLIGQTLDYGLPGGRSSSQAAPWSSGPASWPSGLPSASWPSGSASPWSSGPASPPASGPALPVTTAFIANRPGEESFSPVSRPAGIGTELIDRWGKLSAGGYVAHNSNRIWTSADGRSWKAVRLG